MYKIYSRPRIRLPNGFQNRSGKEKKLSKKLAMVIIVLIIAFSTMKYVLDAVDTLCESKAKSIATNISNEKAIEVMKDYSYEDMFTVEKDENGNITMIKSNITNMNLINSKIALNVQNDFDNLGREDIEIALRKFYRVEVVIR